MAELNIKKNAIFTNDNLYILQGINSESVDLIYLDPPFNSKRMYKAPIGSRAAGAAFKDIWRWDDVDAEYLIKLMGVYPNLADYIGSVQAMHSKPMMAYITYMTERVIELHRILKETGSFYLHCDPTASHYLKHVLDRIFGQKNFRNEIIWTYDIGSAPRTTFPKKHDTIFRYSKGRRCTFNGEEKELRVPYTGIYPQDEEGRIYMQGSDGKVRYKNPHGKLVKDVWSDIQALNLASKEREGYPTQKPLKLLERIVIASSHKGDVVLDPFCGCATTCVASERLGRRWVGIDISEKAVDLVERRMGKDDLISEYDYVALNQPPKRTDVEQVFLDVGNKRVVRRALHKMSGGRCGACGFEHEDVRYFEVDHIMPRSKGGQDIMENLQLLCVPCNREKGDRPNEYLAAVIRRRQEAIARKRFWFG